MSGRTILLEDLQAVVSCYLFITARTMPGWEGNQVMDADYAIQAVRNGVSAGGSATSVTNGGRRLLVCDVCGHAGGCRKVDCPYGYCQWCSMAISAGCRKNPTVRAEMREHCEEHCKSASEEYDRYETETRAVLAMGGYVRKAAVNRGDAVLVWFRNESGDELEMLVTKESAMRGNAHRFVGKCHTN